MCSKELVGRWRIAHIRDDRGVDRLSCAPVEGDCGIDQEECSSEVRLGHGGTHGNSSTK
jgi:hypothetical protein